MTPRTLLARGGYRFCFGSIQVARVWYTQIKMGRICLGPILYIYFVDYRKEQRAILQGLLTKDQTDLLTKLPEVYSTNYIGLCIRNLLVDTEAFGFYNCLGLFLSFFSSAHLV